MQKPIKAQRKPTTVECIQYDGMNSEAVRAFVGEENFKRIGHQIYIRVGKFNPEEGDPWHYVPVGDWVMAEADGSGFYPCASEVFDKLYDVIKGKNVTEAFRQGVEESRQ